MLEKLLPYAHLECVKLTKQQLLARLDPRMFANLSLNLTFVMGNVKNFDFRSAIKVVVAAAVPTTNENSKSY